MKKVGVTQYIADDGTVFNTEEECVNYEKTLIFNVDELYYAAETIKKYCGSNTTCEHCKFFTDIKSSRIDSMRYLRNTIPQRWEFYNTKEK